MKQFIFFLTFNNATKDIEIPALKLGTKEPLIIEAEGVVEAIAKVLPALQEKYAYDANKIALVNFNGFRIQEKDL